MSQKKISELTSATVEQIVATAVLPVALPDTEETRKATPMVLAEALGVVAAQADIDTHTARTDNPHGVTKAQVGLSNASNTSDADKPISTLTQTALDLKEATANKDASNGYAGLTLLKINFWNTLGTFKSFFTNANTAARTYTFPDRDGTIADDTDLALKQNLSEKNAVSGYAGLDGSGFLDINQIPASLLGGVRYQGTWNATTNSPTIPAAAAGNKGYYYKVSVAGTTTIDGISEWAAGDWIISNGTTWDKVDSTDQVSSVFGLQGTVTTASLTENTTPADADMMVGRSNADGADRKFSFLNFANYVITKLLGAARTATAGWTWESAATTNTLRSGTTNTEQHFERANGGLGTETEVVANNTLGSIRFRGWGVQASVGAYRDAARMIGQCRAIASGVVQGRWTLFVSNAAGTLTEIMRAHDAGINIGDAANVDASAVLELTATTRGFLAPRMTTTQRNAISSPATGLLIYNTTNATFERYNGSQWDRIGTTPYASLSANTTLDGTHSTVYVDTSGGSKTITLPDATTCPGREYVIVKAHASNTLTIARTSAQTINGAAADLSITNIREGYRLKSTGTAWEAVFLAASISSAAAFSGARVYRTTNQSISNTTVAAIAFDAERYDTDSYHSTVSNTSRITIPTTGYYRVGATVAWTSSSSGMRLIALELNATTDIAQDARTSVNPGAGSFQTRHTVSCDYYFTAGDYIELVVYQDSGGATNVLASGNYSPEMWIQRLG